MKKRTWVGVNAFFLLVLAAIMLYTAAQKKIETNEAACISFETVVESVQQQPEQYLKNVWELCVSWAQTIGRQGWTRKQAEDFLVDVGSPEVTAQLFCAEELKAYEVSENTPWQVTETYYDAKKNTDVITFFHEVSLADEAKDRFLFVSVPLKQIFEKCVLPESYEEAEFSFIRTDGSFLLSSKEIPENFWERREGLTEEKKEKLREDMQQGQGGSFVLEEKGATYCYAYRKLQGNPEWLLIGRTRMDTIRTAKSRRLELLGAAACIGVLFWANNRYVCGMQRQLEQEQRKGRVRDNGMRLWLVCVLKELRGTADVMAAISGSAVKRLEDTAFVKECLQKLVTAGSRMQLFLSDMQRMSEANEEDAALCPTTFSLSEMVERMLQMLDSQIKAKELQIDVRTHMESDDICTDELRLEQLLYWNIQMAIQDAPIGGEILLEAAQEAIEAAPRAMRLSLALSAKGRKFSEEVIKQLCLPEEQRDKTLLFSSEEGCRLYRMERAAENLGARMELKNEPSGRNITLLLDVTITAKQ